MRLVLSLLLGLSLVACASKMPTVASAPAPVATATFDEALVRSQTVRITDPVHGGTGSGFYWHGYIITALHVVEKAIKSDGQGHFMEGPLYVSVNGNDPVRLIVVGVKPSSDLAVTKTVTPLPNTPPSVTLACRSPRWNENVVAVGNGYGQRNVLQRDYVSTLDVSAGGTDLPGPGMILGEPLAPGMSGGPIFSEDGTVLGFSDAFFGEKDGPLMGYGILIDADICAVLERATNG